MHELSLCQNLIDQLTDLVNTHDAIAVARIEVQVGVLSGVEAQLLRSAFTLAQVGTVADAAELITQITTPRVFCRACGVESDTPSNNLGCPVCASLDTKLIRGHELILARVELVRNEPVAA
ncbi:MAG: hydrogenase maturation nickel metallochaperone HypA [Candidatus Competibacteraceae bacterium]